MSERRKMKRDAKADLELNKLVYCPLSFEDSTCIYEMVKYWIRRAEALEELITDNLYDLATVTCPHSPCDNWTEECEMDAFHIEKSFECWQKAIEGCGKA